MLLAAIFSSFSLLCGYEWSVWEFIYFVRNALSISFGVDKLETWTLNDAFFLSHKAGALSHSHSCSTSTFFLSVNRVRQNRHSNLWAAKLCSAHSQPHMKQEGDKSISNNNVAKPKLRAKKKSLRYTRFIKCMNETFHSLTVNSLAYEMNVSRYPNRSRRAVVAAAAIKSHTYDV